MSRYLKAVAGALVVVAAAACGGAGGGAAITGPSGGTTGSGGATGSGGTVGSSCAANTICMLWSSSSTTYTGVADPGTGSFSPATLTVPVGSTVSFSNSSGVAHDVVFDAASPPGGDIGVIGSGAQTRTFTTAGTYAFHCTIHAGMTGSVTVQ